MLKTVTASISTSVCASTRVDQDKSVEFHSHSGDDDLSRAQSEWWSSIRIQLVISFPVSDGLGGAQG